VVDTGAFAELCVPYADAKRRKVVSGQEPKVYPDGEGQDCLLSKPLSFKLGRRSFKETCVLAWGRDGLRDAEDPITHILGLKFLLRYKTEFDFKRRQMVLHPLSSSPQTKWRGVQAVPFQQVHGHSFLISGTAGKVPGWFFWDTGAQDVYLFPSTLKRLGRRVKWSERELSNVHGQRRHAGPFPLSLSIRGFPPGRLHLRIPSGRGLDMPKDQRAMEEGVGRPLLGLMNVNLCGASRLLIDPESCIIWRLP